MPRNDRVLNFLQSIAIRAVEAQDAHRAGKLGEIWDALNDIEYDLQKLQDMVPFPIEEER